MTLMHKSAALFAAAAMLIGASAHAGSHSKSQSHAHSNTIVDVAIGAGSFNTLVTALKAADLVETLSSEGPFTVFAPTDEAFAALPEGTVEALLADPDKLASILTLHVVAGRVAAADVVKLANVDTVQGAKLAIETSEGVSVGGANVVQADIEASNGIIHVIDRVILPQ